MYNKKEYMKEYAVRNREKLSKYYKKYNAKRSGKQKLYMKAYREDNAVDISLQRRMRQWEVFDAQKRQCIEQYSSGSLKCQCGYGIYEGLCLDHINDDGAEDRKRRGMTSGGATYRSLIREGFPSGYQVLCGGCNQAKEFARRRRNAVKKYKEDTYNVPVEWVSTGPMLENTVMM